MENTLKGLEQFLVSDEEVIENSEEQTETSETEQTSDNDSDAEESKQEESQKEESKTSEESEEIDVEEVFKSFLEEIGYDGEEELEFTAEGIKTALENAKSKIPQVSQEALELDEWLKKGYSIESFRQQASLKPIEIEDSDLEGLENAIRYAESLKGTDEEEIEEIIELAKDTNRIVSKGKKAVEYVNKLVEVEKSKIIAEEERIQQENKKVWQEIDGILQSKKLNGYLISDSEAKNLKSVISNQQKYSELYNGLSLDKKLLLDYVAIKLSQGQEIKGLTSFEKKTVEPEKKKVNIASVLKNSKGSLRDDSEVDFSLLQELNQKFNSEGKI